MITAHNNSGYISGQGENHEKKSKTIPLYNIHYFFWRGFSVPCFKLFLS